MTPFCDGGIDRAALDRQVRYQLQAGCHGLLVLGTLGEGELTTMDERAQVVSVAVSAACGKVPVVAGIHTCNLDEAAAQMKQAQELGASGVLVKYLGRPHASAAEVLGFYTTLSEMHVLPIFYYHYPSETGLKLKSEDVAAILSLPGVVGIKESTLNLPEIKAHIHLTHGLGKAVFTATALNLTQVLDLGGQGAMCPEATVLPGPTVQVYSAHVQGRHDEARALQKDLFALVPIVSTRPSPPALARAIGMSAADHDLPLPLRPEHPEAQMKAALNCLGIPTPVTVKHPLPQLSRWQQHKVESAVARIKAIDWEAASFQVAPVPASPSGVERAGYLLHTGGIQLGQGVGRNWWRWQGDGEGGF
jgi:4-hydroxy-tetrahydrodipicolinate synthase